MLEAIRNKGQSWMAKALLVLISLSFVFWGIGNYFNEEPSTTAVAEVNGNPITVNQFQARYRQESERLRQSMGAALTPQMLESLKLKDQVLEQLIHYQLLQDESERLGLRVSNADVASFIQSIPGFSDAKGFSQTQYEQLLSRQGMTPSMFEAQVRGDLLVRQIEQAIHAAPSTIGQEVNSLYAISEETRKVQAVHLPAGNFAAQTTVVPADLERYYQSHKQQFKTVERVKVQYVVLSPEHFAGKVQVSEGDLKSEYETNKKNYAIEEKRRARHILVRLSSSAKPAEVSQVEAKARTLVQKLRAGADFAVLAKAESADPGSALKGGDLGFFGRGMMVKPFEDVVFSQKVGDISDPVRTPFGFHIVQVQEVQGGGIKPFEQVRAELEGKLRLQKAEKAYDQAMENFKDLLFTQSKSLDAAAKEFGLQIQQSDWLTRSGPPQGIFSSPDRIEKAFAPQVLAGKNSEVMEMPHGGVAALHLLTHEPSKQQTLAEVQGQVEMLVKQDKAKALVKGKAEDLLKSVRAGDNLAELAAQQGYAFQNIAALAPGAGQQGLPQEAVMAVFRAGIPSGGKISANMVSVADGAYVFKVESVTRPDVSAMLPQMRQQISDFLQTERANQAMQSYIATLREKAKVKIYKERM